MRIALGCLTLLWFVTASVWCQPLDGDAVRHLLKRTTLHFEQADVDLVLESGPERYLDRQLSEYAEEPQLEALLGQLPYHGLSPKDIYLLLLDHSDATQIIEKDMQRGRLIRGLQTQQQLREVMTNFWFNHFNADPDKGTAVACNLESLEEDLRQHAFDNFRVLLGKAAKNPAVLENLDNSVSQGVAVNENFGRELMELYTTGPVHTQNEVVEMARIFSGWSYEDNPKSQHYLNFRYFPELHSSGPKIIFDRVFYDHEQEQALDYLAAHPATARFLCTKLVRRFVNDNPPPSLVESASQAYLRTDGHMGQVMRTILTSEEFYEMEHRNSKMKTPSEFVVSVLAHKRDAALESLSANDKVANQIISQLDRMGSPYSCPNPLGWPDRSSTWTSGVGQRARWSVAYTVADSEADLQSAVEMEKATREVISKLDSCRDRNAAFFVSPEFQAR